MDRRFELKPATRGPEGATWEVAEVVVDGNNLVDLLRELERPLAEAEGGLVEAGGYDGLPASLAFFPSRYYLGEPPKYSVVPGYPLGKIPVLGCNCGEVDCNPFLARISVTEKTVVWSEFENFWRGPHSPTSKRIWTYERLGDLTFNRSQYEAALGSYRPPLPAKSSFWKRVRRHR
jgi:hypothetical protein